MKLIPLNFAPHCEIDQISIRIPKVENVTFRENKLKKIRPLANQIKNIYDID